MIIKVVKKIVVCAVVALLSLATTSSVIAAPGDNIALNVSVESCQYVNEDEKDAFLVDEDINYATKWCSTDGDEHEASNSYHWIILDFGSEKMFNKVRLVKASEGERDFGATNMDASAFHFEISTDKFNWEKILNVSGNEAVSIYEGSFEPVTARYLKLTVTAAEADPDSVATVRLYDLKVFEAIIPATEGLPVIEPTDAVQEILPVPLITTVSAPVVPRTGISFGFILSFASALGAIFLCIFIFSKGRRPCRPDKFTK